MPSPLGTPGPRAATRPAAARLRGAAVLLACALLPAPALLAVGDSGPAAAQGPAAGQTGAGQAGAGQAGAAEAVVAAARAQIGDAYRWGGAGPDAWDCSGLTSWAWREAGGVEVPRTSAAQHAWAVPLPREQLLPGDLVFWGDPVSHVALFAGDGRVVDASSSRRGVLERGIWSAPVIRYGRVPHEGMAPVTPWEPSPSPSASGPSAPAATEDGAVLPGTGASTAGKEEGATASGSPTPAPPSAVPAAPAARPTPPAAAVAPATTAPSRPVTPAPATTAEGTAWSEPRTPVAQAGLPARPRAATARATKALRGARSVTGARHFTSTGLVREAWRHAGGGRLPTSPAALLARGRAVPLGDARVGDVVAYGGGAQLYLYAGSGSMVGHSARHGKVVVRRVHQDPTLRLVRLPG